MHFLRPLIFFLIGNYFIEKKNPSHLSKWIDGQIEHEREKANSYRFCFGALSLIVNAITS